MLSKWDVTCQTRWQGSDDAVGVVARRVFEWQRSVGEGKTERRKRRWRVGSAPPPGMSRDRGGLRRRRQLVHSRDNITGLSEGSYRL